MHNNILASKNIIIRTSLGVMVFLANVILIGFETVEPWAFLVAVAPTRTTTIIYKKKKR